MLRARRPALVIGVGGCVAQLEGRAVLDRAPQVDILVGTHTLIRVPEFLKQKGEGEQRLVDLDRKADSFAVPAPLVAHTSPARAYVTVMEGCNHVCSFCVVPRTRGPEVCRPPDDIVSEVELLVARGYPEVMLLGQTVNAYPFGSVDFAGLLSRVHAVRGLGRLRFTTSHPEHVTECMADAFRDLDRLCPYLHLPLQSGSPSLAKFGPAVKPGGIVVYDSSVVHDVPKLAEGVRVIPVPASEIARDLGRVMVKNIVALGALAGASGLFPEETFLTPIRTALKDKCALIPLNEQAFAWGVKVARECLAGTNAEVRS